MKFQLHSKDTAPQDSQALLEKSHNNFGMIPNLHAVMAEAPALLEAYQMAHEIFQKSSFDAEELTVVWQTVNVEHECHYCVPAHTGIAHTMKVDGAITEALRNRTELPTDKLQALHLTTLALVRNRGKLSEKEVTDFFAVGYGRQQLLEIVMGVSQKVMSNYVNQLADTPVDAPFQKFLWESDGRVQELRTG